MNWLLLNAAPGSKIEQALEKLVDFAELQVTEILMHQVMLLAFS